MIEVIERFSDPSRRCDGDWIGAHDRETRICDLPHPLSDAMECARCIPSALKGWINVPVSSEDRRHLFRSCMETGGARIGAFLKAPHLLAGVRRKEIDGIACFSSKDFGLARYLAHQADSECVALLDRGTCYFGEFAFELLAVIPYAYWLHKHGRLEFTVSTSDTDALYYFSPRHGARDLARSYVPITEYPVGVRGPVRYDRKAFPSEIDTARWLPPPYKSVYDDARFRWVREAVIVCNKYSDEDYLWHHAPANFIDTETLLTLIGRLRSRFQVIYVRPRSSDIVNDHQTIYESGDIEAVTNAFPDVLTIQQLRDEHPELGFNELQLRLFAGCRRFVSVLGGSAYLASYFGGTNIVLARRGWEVAAGAYERWFDRFSGARVISARSSRELLDAAASAFD